jgi:myo-inositol 2-dehydrogenase/D-chiro-inositol 1-dehydrogenase
MNPGDLRGMAMSVRLGMMSFAHMHAHAYAAAIKSLPGATLAGVADHDPERARQASALYGAPVFDTYAALLAADIDAVVIASENIRHVELTQQAAAAGRHVLCEKPLATSSSDGIAMIEACKEAGVQLMTAFPCRFSPAMVRLKAAVDEGKIGKVLAIRGTNRGRCPFGWFVELPLSGGGAVIDHTVHVTDLMRWLLGSEVKEVYAEISNRMNHREFDDVGFLTMEFQNGVFATLDTSWSRPKSFPTWGDVTLSVTGEQGVLSLDMFSQNLVLYSDKTGGTSWEPWGSNIDELMMAAFVHAIGSGEPVPITGEDGLRAAQVALAAYESAKQGRPVSPAAMQ